MARAILSRLLRGNDRGRRRGHRRHHRTEARRTTPRARYARTQPSREEFVDGGTIHGLADGASEHLARRLRGVFYRSYPRPRRHAYVADRKQLALRRHAPDNPRGRTALSP